MWFGHINRDFFFYSHLAGTRESFCSGDFAFTFFCMKLKFNRMPTMAFEMSIWEWSCGNVAQIINKIVNEKKGLKLQCHKMHLGHDAQVTVRRPRDEIRIEFAPILNYFYLIFSTAYQIENHFIVEWNKFAHRRRSNQTNNNCADVGRSSLSIFLFWSLVYYIFGFSFRSHA